MSKTGCSHSPTLFSCCIHVVLIKLSENDGGILITAILFADNLVIIYGTEDNLHISCQNIYHIPKDYWINNFNRKIQSYTIQGTYWVRINKNDGWNEPF